MTTHYLMTALLLVMTFALPGSSKAGIIQSGDLNIIDDAANPSNGLRYLDMSYSTARTLANALVNAQSTYANVRVATRDEFDDLFAAAGIRYDTIGVSASSGFDTGGNLTLSSAANYDAGVLRTILGPTAVAPFDTIIWTDPDFSENITTTRDYMRLESTKVTTIQNASSVPHSAVGWLLVSDAAPLPPLVSVPEPASLAIFGIGALGLVAGRRRNRS